MAYKFEKLEVWQLALEYIDMIYKVAELLPKNEEYNLRSQIIRAATSIALNIAEGSTGQSDAEQNRFLGMALRSLIETVACLHLIKRRNYYHAGHDHRRSTPSAENYRSSCRSFARERGANAPRFHSCRFVSFVDQN